MGMERDWIKTKDEDDVDEEEGKNEEVEGIL